MVSRSIGDLELKKYGVTARPELRSVRIKHGKDQFLAFTSDGINFVMRDEEVVDCINKCEGAKEGAARLVDQVRSSKIAGSCRFECFSLKDFLVLGNFQHDQL